MPPVFWILVPTHTSTHKHTTHLGTGTAKGITANGEVHVTTLKYCMQCTKKRTQIRGPAPYNSCNTLCSVLERREEGLGLSLVDLSKAEFNL